MALRRTFWGVRMDEECVVVIPAKFADGRRVVVQKCTKTERDEECNYCYPKYQCKLFVDSLPTIVCGNCGNPMQPKDSHCLKCNYPVDAEEQEEYESAFG